jgi:hypothetical protein
MVAIVVAVLEDNTKFPAEGPPKEMPDAVTIQEPAWGELKVALAAEQETLPTSPA